MRRLPAALLAATLLAASACGSGDPVDLEPVTEALTTIESAQADLRSRMSDIESSVTALGTSSGDPDAVNGLLEQLDALETLIATLRSELDQLVLDDAATEAELRDLITNLESTMNGVTTGLASLRSDVSSLREDHELLKQRFERHLQDNHG